MKNIFKDNFAVYGNDLSSYAVKILVDQNNFEVVSGQTIKQNYTFWLLDHFNQTILNDNSSVLNILSENLTNYGPNTKKF